MSKNVLRNAKINGKAILNSPFIFEWSLTNLSQNLWTDITYGPENTLVVTGLNVWSYSIDNGSTWAALSTINLDFGNEFHNAVAYGNGKWSMLENINIPSISKNCYTSTNILTGWTRSNLLGTTLSPMFSSFGYSDMLFNSSNNKFLAFVDQKSQTVMATNAVVIYSDDGVSWLSGGYFKQTGESITAPQGFGHGAVGTNMPNSRLVACGGAGSHKLGFSNNGGLTWLQSNYNPNSIGQNLQAGCVWNQVSYGYNNYVLPVNGRFVAVNNFGSASTYQFAYSNDGIDWIGVSFPSGNPLKKNWKTITYAKGYFVALSDVNGYQAQSKDGINWNIYQKLPYTNSNSVGDTVVANKRIIALYDSNIAGSNVAISIFYR